MNDPKSQAEYIESLRSFDSRYTAIFPDRIPNNMLTMNYSSLFNMREYGNLAGINMTTKFSSSKKYEELKNQFKSKAAYIGTSSDKCLLMIDFQGNVEVGFDRYNCDSLIPIPQYGDRMSNESIDKPQQKTNEEIIIMDYQFGNVNIGSSDRERTIEPENKYFTGFSTGISLNDIDLTIKYWMIIW